MKNVLDIFKKKIFPIIMFMLLLLGMAGFSYIPIALFGINVDKFSLTTLTLYMFACDVCFMIILFFLYKNKITTDFKNYFKNFWKNCCICVICCKSPF